MGIVDVGSLSHSMFLTTVDMALSINKTLLYIWPDKLKTYYTHTD